MSAYGEDLAYIHHAGFSDYARKAAPGLLALLRRNDIRKGLVVDLGCGSGVWARELLRAGYDVLGIDQSPAMIALAKKHARGARFLTGSLHRVALPPCDAVTSVGECLNYGDHSLGPLFRRVRNALRPGGIFLFDIAEPARMPPARQKVWVEGEDWAILVEIAGDPRHTLLTRRIVSFRKRGNAYRRGEEIHRLRLYDGATLSRQLTALGFDVRIMPGFGRFLLLPGMVALLARRG